MLTGFVQHINNTSFWRACFPIECRGRFAYLDFGVFEREARTMGRPYLLGHFYHNSWRWRSGVAQRIRHPGKYKLCLGHIDLLQYLARSLQTGQISRGLGPSERRRDLLRMREVE